MAEGTDDPRIYFAAERTFLAWIRTGLGLIGVGFALARFGLFLRELPGPQPHLPGGGTGLSVWTGVALVALGVIVNVVAIAHHVRTVRALRSNTWVAGRVSSSAVLLASLLAVIGVGVGIYLVAPR